MDKVPTQFLGNVQVQEKLAGKKCSLGNEKLITCETKFTFGDETKSRSQIQGHIKG